jgi:hypothetical protein
MEEDRREASANFYEFKVCSVRVSRQEPSRRSDRVDEREVATIAHWQLA